MKRYLPIIIIIGVLSVALGAGVTLWRSAKQSQSQPSGELLKPAPTAAPTQSGAPVKPADQIPVSQTGQTGTDNGHARGGANAKVTLEEYGDYQCPPCGGLFPELKKLEKEYGDQMRFVFRHFPLQGHKHARIAAHAAEAAALQGRFWEMHDLIYQNQAIWTPVEDARANFIQYARDLKLDIDRFTRDMDSPAVAARVTADYNRGSAAGVNGTPALFMNGRQMNPNSVTPEGLRMALDYMLGKKK
ncbi:MAG: thioredoxin domain-containing protein [Acidobacteria bacterium]|nr:thioredoxin domain-containing protein [Acidobacteriota bacterium]